jgi:RNA polymerase sigma-70 factor (ECF subfamily)
MFPARRPLERHSFDLEYVNKLSHGEAETAAHFMGYFTKLLLMKLRMRMRAADEAQDVAQETLFRVLRYVQKHGGIDQPEALGAFVNKVSENVVMEFIRNGRRFQQVPENIPEPVEQALSAELNCITRERKQRLREVLGKLRPNDRVVLEKVFLDEQDKDEICTELKINRNTLRVQVFRALKSLRKAFDRENDGSNGGPDRKAAAN